MAFNLRDLQTQNGEFRIPELPRGNPLVPAERRFAQAAAPPAVQYCLPVFPLCRPTLVRHTSVLRFADRDPFAVTEEHRPGVPVKKDGPVATLSQEQSQLTAVQLDASLPNRRQNKTALLQALVPERQAVPVPIENLDVGPPAVDEHVVHPRFQAAAVLVHQGAQAPKRLPHVRRTGVEVDAAAPGETQHGDATARSSRTRVSGSKSRSTSIAAPDGRRSRTPVPPEASIRANAGSASGAVSFRRRNQY